jgi:hypothetical protein
MVLFFQIQSLGIRISVIQDTQTHVDLAYIKGRVRSLGDSEYTSNCTKVVSYNIVQVTQLKS